MNEDKVLTIEIAILNTIKESKGLETELSVRLLKLLKMLNKEIHG